MKERASERVCEREKVKEFRKKEGEEKGRERICSFIDCV